MSKPDAPQPDRAGGPVRHPYPRLRALALGLLHAGLFSLAFPPLNWWWMVFAAPVPLLLLAARPGGSAVSAGFWAMLGVMPFWAWTHAWIDSISALGVYPLVVYLSLYAWAFVVLGSRAVRARGAPAALALALVWVGLEFVRGRIGWNGYAWYLTGHPLIESPGGAWPATLGGVHLVSLMVVLPGAWAVTRVTRPGGPRWLGPAIGVLCAAWLGFGVVWAGSDAEPTGEPVRIALVQTDIPQDNRLDWTMDQRVADWRAMRALTVRAARAEPAPDLIVWPEGMVPGFTLDPVSLAQERSSGVVWWLEDGPGGQPASIPATRVVDEMLALQRTIGVPMLVGATAFDGLNILSSENGLVYERDAMFNSAFLIQHGRVSDVWYDKIHLTPFGETMPYISAWPWLEKKLLAIGARGMSFGLVPARTARAIRLDLPDGRSVGLATPICFEATMPAVCRRLANLAAAGGRQVVLVNITNDGWFGRSERGRRVHELCARWRCVELGLPMARCANTGISSAVDRKGRIIVDLPAHKAGVLAAALRPGGPGTLYAKTGDWAGWGALLSLPVLLWLSRRRNSSEPDAPDEGTQGSDPRPRSGRPLRDGGGHHPRGPMPNHRV